ncbi:aminopeptidase N [Shewanella sp.]|uniref:aminopeptidase N n=2 Tax=Shewanella sp. TaxID=50422 RepID=UPI0040543F0D
MSQSQAKYLKDYQTPAYTITHVDLAFNLDESRTQVRAKSKVVRLGSADEPLVLVGEQLNMLSVTIDGKAARYQEIDGELRIETQTTEFELEIITALDPEKNSSLEGLYMSDGAYCTQCEAEGFRRISYFLDRPDVLATYTVRIEADRAAFPFLLSNGNLMEQGDAGNGRHFVCWQDPFPKPSYLFALVAGDFDLLEDQFVTMSERTVKLQVFVDKGNLHKASHAMASLKKSMKWDEERFGLEYDLDIYMIVAVDFFNMGAMENKGLNIFNTKYVLADTASATDEDYHGIESVVGHEYFHNWTGNRITCRDWFQLSLKEGLTVFRDQEFSSDVGSRAVNRIHAIKVMKNQQFAEDSSPMAHPIRPESVIEMNNFYTVTVYNKGAEVIRMLHTLLGEQGFQAGMKTYVERHDGQAVTCDDFVNAMEDASSKDLSQFRRWYAQAGTPVVKVERDFNQALSRFSLTLSQSVKGVDGKLGLPLHIPFSIELLDRQGKSLENKVLELTQASQVFHFDNITQAPVVSLLQDFSAPVKLDYQYKIEELVHLMAFASSEVARWEASVSLISHAIWQSVQQRQSQTVMTMASEIIDAFRGVILDESLDPALVAEMLSFPSAAALIEQVDNVELDALAQAREFILAQLAASCEDELAARYQSLVNKDDAASRAYKNTCLLLLCQVSDSYEVTVQQQYDNASNMTDSLAALKGAVKGQFANKGALLADFEAKWHHTPLVMDKWFALQAMDDSEDVIQTLKSLSKHPSFSFNNPNRVRSLIGTFAMGNTYQFHNNNASGYQYLTEILIKLNDINPQLASRMVTPLIQFAKFDLQRQGHIRTCLDQLLVLPGLSKDVFEKVSKALA